MSAHPHVAVVRPSLLSAATGKGSSTSTHTTSAVTQATATSTSTSSSPSASPSRRAAPSYSRSYSHSRSALSLAAVSALDIEQSQEGGRLATPPGSISHRDDDDDDTERSSLLRIKARDFAAARSVSPGDRAHTPEGDLLRNDKEQASDNDSEVEDEDMASFDSRQLVARSSSPHATDPRVMLREQLKRSESARGGLHRGSSATHGQGSHLGACVVVPRSCKAGPFVD